MICRWLSLALCDVGWGVSSIKKSLKLRESMVGSTLLAKGASRNYSIHHNYTKRTLLHRGQGTQISSWPHWTRLRAYREEGRKRRIRCGGWKLNERKREAGLKWSIRRIEEVKATVGKEEGFRGWWKKKEGQREVRTYDPVWVHFNKSCCH